MKLTILAEELAQFERFNHLIQTKATGTPEDLSKKIGLSKRQIFRYIEDLKEIGVKVNYCKKRCTYYYEEDIFLKFQACIIKDGQERKIIGGENIIFNYFENIFQSDIGCHSGLSPLYQVENNEEQSGAGSFRFLGFKY